MIEINYNASETSRIFKNFKGSYDGHDFILNANWESGDDSWEVDFINFHDYAPEDLETVEDEIIEEFLNYMN